MIGQMTAALLHLNRQLRLKKELRTQPRLPTLGNTRVKFIHYIETPLYYLSSNCLSALTLLVGQQEEHPACKY